MLSSFFDIVQIIPHKDDNRSMSNVLFETDSFVPLNNFAPKFADWLSSVDRANKNSENHDVMRYYGQKLTAAEAAFCGSFARHVVLGTVAPNLNEGSFDCSPMYRQALLEQIVRERLKNDGYVFPLAIKI